MIEKLSDLKKETAQLEAVELADICLRLARYKKENKELLSYLLFYADDPLAYAELVKNKLEPDFKSLQKHYYYSSKSLRKILRLLNKHIKFTGDKQVEVELLTWFCRNYLLYADNKTSHKPLRMIFLRQAVKLKSVLLKLHEDLQYDYNNDFAELLTDAEQKLSWFSKSSVI